MKVSTEAISTWAPDFVASIRRHYTGSRGASPGKKMAWRIKEGERVVGFIGLGELSYKLAPRRALQGRTEEEEEILAGARPLLHTVGLFIFRLEEHRSNHWARSSPPPLAQPTPPGSGETRPRNWSSIEDLWPANPASRRTHEELTLGLRELQAEDVRPSGPTSSRDWNMKNQNRWGPRGRPPFSVFIGVVNPPRICDFCGKEFFLTRDQITQHRDRKFCSRECYQASDAAWWKRGREGTHEK